MSNEPVEIRLRLYKQFSLETDLRVLVEVLQGTGAFFRVTERNGEQWVYVDERLTDKFIEQRLIAHIHAPQTEVAPRQNKIPTDFILKALVQYKVVILVFVMTLLCAIDTALGSRLLRVESWLIVDFDEGLSDGWFGYITSSGSEVAHKGLEWNYRLISPIFLHFGAMHFIFNLLWWRLLGGQVELRFGSWFLLILTLSGGVASNVSQYLYQTRLPLFGGLSGVIYVLVGFIAVWNRSSKLTKLPVRKEVLIFMVMWLLLCMSGLMETFGIYVANAAHIGGLAWGVTVGLLVTLYAERRQD
jgi:GlpG protein